MAIATLDDKGRLLIPREIREEYGNKYFVFAVLDEVVLRPVPKDPLKTLREEGKKLPKGMSVAELKKQARELIVEDIEEEMKELRNKARKK